MSDSALQRKELINGMPTNFLCHMQLITEAGVVYPAHFHSYIELLYIISGKYEADLNNFRHPFGAGDLVIINSNELHQIHSLLPYGEYYVLRFEPEVIYNSMFDNYEDSKYVFPFLLGNSIKQKIIGKNVIANTFLPDAFRELMREFSVQDYGYELAAKIHIERIFLWLLRYFHNTASENPIPALFNSELTRHLAPCFNYVTLHYDEELTAISMASLCNMSTSYFSRIFNRLMGMTFHQYVNYLRIQAAEKLLLSTSRNITEISSMVGFNTTSYFIKTFREYRNISPKQFQKQFQQPAHDSERVPFYQNSL